MSNSEDQKFDPPLSPIILGITGHRHLPGDIPALRASLTRTFKAFSKTPAVPPADPDAKDAMGCPVYELRRDLGFPEKLLKDGLPAGTPVWILSPMAEGADILSAVVAHEFYKETFHPFHIVAALPVPLSYRLSRTQADSDLTTDGLPVGGAYRWDHRKQDLDDQIRGAEIIEVRDALKELRGTLPTLDPKDPSGEPTASNYTEFVLPVGGRMILRQHTCFPEDGFPQWAGDPAEYDFSPLGLATASPADIDKLFGDIGNMHHHLQTGATYASLYCNVLIALWDGHLRVDSVGTDAAVRINIGGPDSEQLSHGPIFSWADSGPVVQIFTPNENPTPPPIRHDDDTATKKLIGNRLFIRQRESEDNEGAEQEELLTGDIKVLHPADCALGDKPEDRDKHGKIIFGGILSGTTMVNEDLAKVDTPNQYFDPLYQEEEPFTTGDPFDRLLHSIQIKGATASQRSKDLKSGTLKIFGALFILVTSTAIFFDLYAHDYAGVVDGHPAHKITWLLVFFGFFCAAASLFWYGLHKGLDWIGWKAHPENRYLEYRALAEGVRVQLAWLAAGVPQSVPLHYLQRHRGAFDWIQNTISAWCFPYENGQRRFDRIKSPVDKIARLRVLLVRWVNDQRTYFSKEGPAELRRHHTIHLLGTATALVGVYAALFLISNNIPTLLSHLSGHGDTHATHHPRGVLDFLSAIVFLAGVGFGISSLRERLPHPEELGHGGIPLMRGKSNRKVSIHFWLAMLAPIAAGSLCGRLDAINPSGGCSGAVKFAIICTTMIGVGSFLAVRYLTPKKEIHDHLPFIPFATAAVSLSVFCLCTMLSPLADPHHAPEAVPYVLLIGLPLLLGALLVAWGEKMLHSEHGNRFCSAGELFRLTSLRLTESLDRAELSHVLAGHIRKLDGKRVVLAIKDALVGSLTEGITAQESTRRWEQATAELWVDFPESDHELKRLTFAQTLLKDEIQRCQTKSGLGPTDFSAGTLAEVIAALDAACTCHIGEAQDILFELGKEALAENAEWLLIHRARPLEFPMAG